MSEQGLTIVILIDFEYDSTCILCITESSRKIDVVYHRCKSKVHRVFLFTEHTMFVLLCICSYIVICHEFSVYAVIIFLL